VSAKLTRRVSVAPENFLFTLDVGTGFPEPRPGQFVQVSTLSELTLRRPFSVAGVREERLIDILVELRGKGTHGLASLPYRAELDVLGPLGSWFSQPEEGETAVLVAGGIGVAGLRMLAQELLGEAVRTLALVGARTGEMLLDHLLPAATGGGRARIATATDDGSSGFRGTVTELLEHELHQLRSRARIYCCGPHGMIREVARIAKRTDTPCEALLEEIMACGVGACRGCVVRTNDGYVTACKDGPVFDTADLVFEEALDA
jgi:dihydroorotate dehydrogenase electron transfer subunit